jgi:CRISPR-associated endonuclease/helicase Cas3
MKVMFVSQCSKNALVETRRIIDQFAERKGDCVWQTHITEHGLETLRKLLKSTARRNTAVACHLFRGRQQTELLWIVGNARKFNQEGSVPTNTTGRDVLRADDENDWNTGEAIAILAGIAGLFHDFGKANALFQSKLRPGSGIKHEPFRHEWISLLLFKGFVGEFSDKEWIERLSQISLEDEKQILKNFPEKHEQRKNNPLKGLPKLAKFIGWLILSHHRLPVIRNSENEPRLDNIDEWMEGKRFSALWNSYYCDDKKWEDPKQVGSFPEGTPFRSKSWRFSARKAAIRALRYYYLLDRDWFQDRFTMHLTRAALMLSDHCYSAGKVHAVYQDADYDAYANTERATGFLKQKLDEHNVGVARSAFLIAKYLPKLRENLPSIARHKGFKKRSLDDKFLWQDKAYDLAFGLKNASQDRGFFGINLASTGCGKTLANARIMYGLSNERQGCRFSIALGLRVLTLQTGDALRERLSLKNDDVAVMIGSRAFQQLHELNNNENEFQDKNFSGSESSEDLLDEQDYVSYEGSLDDGRLSKWLSSSPKLHKMVSAPILVSTIDHLIPATEGCRGGKQIAPLLRLLTADLVLDEPDDFDVADLHALCRLVNFAGVCGSRVLLSSATLPPSIVKALFEAYSSGRRIFNQACRRPGIGSSVCCAWFDEFGVSSSEHESSESYMSSHREFVEARIAQLEQQPVLRRASLVPVDLKGSSDEDAKRAVADSIRSTLYHLHDKHHQVNDDSGKRISVGLVRMANIDPMVGVVQSLLSEPAKPDYCIHFCVYHSRFPLLIRSKIEKTLDSVLSRHKPDQIWKNPEIVSSLSGRSESNHIFVVFATSVAEVGRDHDYDWAVVEPSSMRSIIQLAGRIQRHRRLSPSEPNLMILQNNLKGLRGCEVAYNRPGFESQKYRLATKDLTALLQPSQFEQITAIPRLRASDSKDFRNNLVDLEHVRLEAELLGTGKGQIHSSLWWKHNMHWCGELQRLTPFRKKEGIDKEYIMYLEEEGDKPKIHEWQQDGRHIPVDRLLCDRVSFPPAQGIRPWINCDVGEEIERHVEEMNLSLREVCLKFTRISLRELRDQNKWKYDPVFGFYET